MLSLAKFLAFLFDIFCLVMSCGHQGKVENDLILGGKLSCVGSGKGTHCTFENLLTALSDP